jgi:hypothetical protein
MIFKLLYTPYKHPPSLLYDIAPAPPWTEVSWMVSSNSIADSLTVTHVFTIPHA